MCNLGQLLHISKPMTTMVGPNGHQVDRWSFNKRNDAKLSHVKCFVTVITFVATSIFRGEHFVGNGGRVIEHVSKLRQFQSPHICLYLSEEALNLKPVHTYDTTCHLVFSLPRGS